MATGSWETLTESVGEGAVVKPLAFVATNSRGRQASRVAARQDQDTAILADARIEAGVLLRRLQRGDRLSLPASRPMPIVGRRCHELRIADAGQTWRIIYRLDADAVVIAEVFSKKTATTPTAAIDVCRLRLRQYDDAVKG